MYAVTKNHNLSKATVNALQIQALLRGGPVKVPTGGQPSSVPSSFAESLAVEIASFVGLGSLPVFLGSPKTERCTPSRMILR
jgi:hypothetical protein